jgi:hypothetical protein
MSTDFIALFDASSNALDPEWLLRELVARPAIVAEAVERYGHLWRPKAWEITPRRPLPPPLPTLGPELLGPGGFAITFELHMIELYHSIRFSMFTRDPTHRTMLRGVCLSIADIVDSGRVIYTHEGMPHPGEGLRDVEARLRTNIGPPAETFAALDAALLFGPRAWYVDTFTDLRKPVSRGA